MANEPDVVIVGGGIAGSALAIALARGGVEVVVLEATEVFEDRVRGESMMPWGVAEAAGLGVLDPLRAAGAHTAPLWKRYPASGDDVTEIPVGLLVEGVDGNLNLEHRLACQALLDEAAAAGARVHRGVRCDAIAPGARPSIAWTDATGDHVIAPALLVGADGRGSAVRRATGIELDSQPVSSYVAGLLIEGLEGPSDHDVVADDALGMCLLLHQGGGRARAYHAVPDGLQTRWTGPDGPARFVSDLAEASPLLRDAVGSARPAGPCRTYPGTDTWTDRPYADGVVLIGDAAGHNDPTIGCGLSIAMRDARIVRDLVLAGACSSDAFAPYGDERADRMRRLRLVADVMVTGLVEDAPNRTERRAFMAESLATLAAPVFPLVLGMFAGPESIPDEVVDEAVLDVVRAA